MTKYRKKPVVIEARQVTLDNMEQVANWCRGLHRAVLRPRPEQFILIPTLEGEMTATPGDYVIQGVAGEFYPCKPDIFTATYEEV